MHVLFNPLIPLGTTNILMENFFLFNHSDCKNIYLISFMGKKIGKRDNSNTVFTQSVLLPEKLIKYIEWKEDES